MNLLVLCYSPRGRFVGYVELVEANYEKIAPMFLSSGLLG